MAQLIQVLGNVSSEAPQSNQKNGFHKLVSLSYGDFFLRQPGGTAAGAGQSREDDGEAAHPSEEHQGAEHQQKQQILFLLEFRAIGPLVFQALQVACYLNLFLKMLRRLSQ